MFLGKTFHIYLRESLTKKNKEVNIMAYSQTYNTNHTTQIAVRGKCKAANKIRAAVRHNTRQGREGQGAHIDKRREYLNRDLLNGQGSDDIYRDIINRVTGKSYSSEDVPVFGTEPIYYADGKKIRDGGRGGQNCTVLAFETEMRYPGNMVNSTFDENGNVVPVPKNETIDEIAVAPYGQEVRLGTEVSGIGKGYFLYPENEKEFEEWVKASTEFLKDRFGEQNVMEAVLHMDENTPHIHAICAPIVEDEQGYEKLAFNKIIDGREGLYNLQTEYAEAVAHLGYKRGEEFSPMIANISTKQYKAGLNKAVNEKLPTDLDSAVKEVKNLRADNYELQVKMKETMGTARQVQKLRTQKHDLIEENKALKSDLEKRSQEVQNLQRLLEIKELKEKIREKGLENYPNQEAVDIVKKLDAEFEEIGKKYLKDLGYNVDLKFYEDINYDGINDKNQFIDENHNGVDDRLE